MKLIVWLCPLVFVVQTFATPSGFQPVSGNPTYHIDASGAHIIQSGHQAIIHWDQFSINKGENVTFLQNNHQSSVLNHVKGGSLSKIYGSIQSNGKVFLVNPAGVFIGPDAKIQCAGFLAATANIPDDAFLSGGDFLLNDFGDGEIVNLGTIQCPQGDVSLLARFVQDSGTIQANNIALIAGTEVLLKSEGPILIQSSLGKCVKEKNPYALAIKSEGALLSQKINEEGGKIFLVSDGITEANGALITSGGTIHILGEEVIVGEKAHLDVSADYGGGNILIGGDFGGKNPAIKNAQKTTLLEGAEIHADSYLLGDAGKISIWSDTDTVCAASSVTAQAYGASGNGGFLEVSGAKTVAMPTIPNLRSLNGKTGTTLIDPEGAILIDGSASSGPDTWGSTHINTVLAGSALTINTANSSGVGSPTMTISAAAAISWNTTNLLELIAGGNIIINPGASIENTLTGSGNFEAMSLTGSGVGTSDTFGVAIEAGSTVQSNEGNIRITGTGGPGAIGSALGVIIAGSVTSTGAGADAAQIIITGTGGNNTGGGNSGIFCPSPGAITSTSGDITLLGNAGTSGVANSRGVHISGAGVRVGSTTGQISITGTGGGTAQDNRGIEVSLSSIIQSTSGNITLDGTGSATGTIQSNIGVLLIGSPSITTESGNITLIGQGGAGTVDNGGITGFSSVSISSESGQISLTGVAGGSTNDNNGIILTSTSITSNTSSPITLHGTGSAAATSDSNIGIVVQGASTIVSPSGNVTLTGIGGTAGSTLNHGVEITGASTEISSTSGQISITGTGGGVANANNGIEVSDTALVSSTNNQVTLNGTGGPAALTNSNRGIHLTSGASIQTSTGNMTLIGDGGVAGTSSNDGINVNSASTNISSTSGQITLTGTGRGTTSGNNGITLSNTATIASTNNLVTLNGTAGSNALSTSNKGILVDTGATISTAGNITATGVGGVAGTSLNDGIAMAGVGSGIISTSGEVSLTGTVDGANGSDNNGVNISSGTISSADSQVTVVGTGSTSGTSDNHGILIDGSLSTLSGVAMLTGTGGGSGDTNTGITMSGASTVSNTSDLTFTGNGGPVGAASFGVSIIGTGTQAESTGGSLTITGNSGAGTESGVLISASSVDSNNAILVQAFSDIIINEGAQVMAPGSLTLDAARDLTIQGADTLGTDTTVTSGGDALFTAGRDILFLNGAMSDPVITSTSNLTLVTDNDFPTSPTKGPGGFTIESNALVTVSGEFRIYTVSPEQNSINAPLNGGVFIPGPFGVDTNTEKWGVYFDGGTFGGPNFTIYYKVDAPSPEPEVAPSESFKTSLAISQASSLLPVIHFGQLSRPGFNRVSTYHGHFCYSKNPASQYLYACLKNDFSPYRAFIFEDDMFWTDTQ